MYKLLKDVFICILLKLSGNKFLKYYNNLASTAFNFFQIKMYIQVFNRQQKHYLSFDGCSYNKIYRQTLKMHEQKLH